MARKITQEKFRSWIAEEGNLEGVLELIAGGLTLQKTAIEVKQPYTCLYDHFHSTKELEARYAAARKAWVAARKDGLVEKVETVKADRDEVAKLKLEADIIDNQAKAYHREMWGERIQVEKSVSVTVDAGPATQLLQAAKQRAIGNTVTIENAAPVKLVESDAG